MLKEAIVLAGGLGTRLRGIIKDVPKPMADINGKPFLEYVLLFLDSQGIDKVVLAVGYKFENIKNYFGKKFRNLSIKYSIENELLGTGGAIKQAIELTTSNDVVILNGDTFFRIDMSRLYEFYRFKRGELVVALTYINSSKRYGFIKIDSDSRIVCFTEKGKEKDGFINAGIYILNRNIFKRRISQLSDKFSFEQDYLEKFYHSYSFYGLPFQEYFVDIGVPDDYCRAKKEFFYIIS